jgi:hypothetical protein
VTTVVIAPEATERRRRSGLFTQALGSTPWSLGDAQRLLVRLLLGLAVIVAAWIGASGTLTWRNQVIWTAVGTGGVLIAVMGGAGWLLPAFGAIKMHQRAVKLDLIAITNKSTVAHATAKALPNAALWAPGMTKFHAGGCDLVVGKKTQYLSDEECRRLELLPCGMCHR